MNSILSWDSTGMDNVTPDDANELLNLPPVATTLFVNKSRYSWPTNKSLTLFSCSTVYTLSNVISLILELSSTTVYSILNTYETLWFVFGV